jgi:catechol 2,3-dioxygenase-like lactoylglutathione lyase family enzyme
MRSRRAPHGGVRPLNCGVRPQPRGYNAMIDHIGIGVADVAVSAAFYDAALGALGMRRVMQLPEVDGSDAVGYGVEYPVFWIDRFHPHGVRQHTAFAAQTRGAVDSFHQAALKAGGVDNGAPGVRAPLQGNSPGYYGAFVLDPDGNNIEAVYRGG